VVEVGAVALAFDPGAIFIGSVYAGLFFGAVFTCLFAGAVTGFGVYVTVVFGEVGDTYWFGEFDISLEVVSGDFLILVDTVPDDVRVVFEVEFVVLGRVVPGDQV
jgi:hypothetical protein